MSVEYRYFERPHDFSTYPAEPRPCDLCGQKRPGYGDPFYGDDGVEFVCEECLASWRLAERDLTTNEGDHAALRRQLDELRPDLDAQQRPVLMDARTPELETRTPLLITWQPFFWPAHCGDYCRFIKEVGAPDIRRLAGERARSRFPPTTCETRRTPTRRARSGRAYGRTPHRMGGRHIRSESITFAACTAAHLS